MDSSNIAQHIAEEPFFETSEKLDDDAQSNASDSSFHSIAEDLEDCTLEQSLGSEPSNVVNVTDIKKQENKLLDESDDKSLERVASTISELIHGASDNASEQLATHAVAPGKLDYTPVSSIGESTGKPVSAHADGKPELTHADCEPVSAHADGEPVLTHADGEPVSAHADGEPVSINTEAPDGHSSTLVDVDAADQTKADENIYDSDQFDICCLESVKAKDEEYELAVKDRCTDLSEEKLEVTYRLGNK